MTAIAKRRQSIQNWQTPRPLFKWLQSFISFTVDAAADATNALLPRFWTMQDDALTRSWAGEVVFFNPPFWDVKSWVKKAVEEAESGNPSVGLMPAAFETEWFRTYAKRGKVVVLSPRLKYDLPTVPRDRFGEPIPVELLPKTNEGPPSASMLVFFEPGQLNAPDADDFHVTLLNIKGLLAGAANEDLER
jgi:phage N-6-adenine-methyltransferase